MSVQIGQQLASYEIITLLGKGGMGEVYRAKDTNLKREVAIKILPEEFSLDSDRVTRFQREAEGTGCTQSSEYRRDLRSSAERENTPCSEARHL